MPASSIPDIVAARRKPGDGSAPWSSPLASLPWDIEDVLKCAAGDSAALAAAAKACGTRPVVTESACRWFIRHVLFRSGASYYWNLGVERDASIDLIRAHYRHLISIFHPDRLQQSDEREWYESFAKRVNEAYNTLKNGESRLKYDRLQNGGMTAPMDRRSSNSDKGGRDASPQAPPRHERHPIFARATWRNAPSRGAVPEWIETRRPTTLKVLAFGSVVLLAVGAVALTRAHKSPAADVALPGDPAALAIPEHSDARLSDLLVKPNASAATPIQTASIMAPSSQREGAAAGADIKGSLANSRSTVGVARNTVAAASTVAPVHDVSKIGTLPAARTEAEPRAAVASMDPRASAAGTETIAVPAVPPAPIQSVANSDPMPIAAPAPAAPSLNLSAMDIDQLVEHLARSYDNGDIGALTALIDPEQARDDRMAFTMANFSRVFHETTLRKIELREVVRSIDADRARVQLETRTVTFGSTTGQRTDLGQMTLIVRKRGNEAVITEMQYRDKVGG